MCVCYISLTDKEEKNDSFNEGRHTFGNQFFNVLP